jgi:hypothetical protein
MGIYPRRERGWERNTPARVRGDPRGEFVLSRGRVWGAKTRRGFPRCHP